MVDRGRLNFCRDRILILDEDWEPSVWDVICQGGGEAHDHVGNRRFRVCIDNNLNTYMAAKSKHEKSTVVTVIVDAVKESSTQGRGGFVRKDLVSGRWFEVGDKIAREKVGHALRDAIKLRQRKLEIKKSRSGRERPQRAEKRRRTGAAAKQNSTSKDAKLSSVYSKGEFWSFCRKESNKKKALWVGVEQFSALNQSDHESRSGDSVLDEMALATSVPDTDVVEKAYQTSLAQLHQAGAEDSLPFSFIDAAEAVRKPPVHTMSTGKWRQNSSFDDFMKRFLGPFPVSNSPGTATPNFVWKPPGDSATEAAFDSFMKKLDPKPPVTHSTKTSSVDSLCLLVRYILGLICIFTAWFS